MQKKYLLETATPPVKEVFLHFSLSGLLSSTLRLLAPPSAPF